jgi:hypothetical protein
MSFRLAGEEVDERSHDEPARRGNRDTPVPGEPLCHSEGVLGLGQNALLEHHRESFGTLEEDRLHGADEEAEDDRTQRPRQAAGDRDQDHEEVARAACSRLSDGIGADDRSSSVRARAC